jgi:hypothetical protein
MFVLLPNNLANQVKAHQPKENMQKQKHSTAGIR